MMRLINILMVAVFAVVGGGVAGHTEVAVADTRSAVATAKGTQDLLVARQHERNFEFGAALDAYVAAIERFEASDGLFAEALLDPLLGLGRMQHQLGMLEQARASFQRGQHIVHRIRGVHALEQLEVIEHLTRISVGLGEHINADRQQRFAVYVAEHNYGADDPALVLELEKLATWYEETGQYSLSRRAHQRILNIVLANGSETDVELIAPLLAIMRTRRLQSGACCSRKELRQVTMILNTSRRMSPERKAQALLALGDNFTALGRPSRAHAYYIEAWALLDEAAQSREFSQPRQLAMFRRITSPHRDRVLDGNLLRGRSGIYAREPLLASPRALEDFLRSKGATDQQLQEMEVLTPQFFVIPQVRSQYNTRIRDIAATVDGGPRTLAMVGEPIQFLRGQLKQAMPPRLQADEALDKIAIRLSFAVGPEGQVRRVSVEESNAPARLNQLMRAVVAKSRFRPRNIDGAFVATDGVQLVQTFSKLAAKARPATETWRNATFYAR